MDIREKIAQDLKANYYHRSPLEQADQILAFIKEAGYKSPEEITSFLSSIAEDTLKKARAGYIQLADDKEMPYFTHHTTEEIERLTKGEVYGLAQVDMLKQGWRKVKREGIDGH